MSGLWGYFPAQADKTSVVEHLGEVLHEKLKHRGRSGGNMMLWDTAGNVSTGPATDTFRAVMGGVWSSTMENAGPDYLPVTGSDGRYTLIFDGAILNVAELRRRLGTETGQEENDAATILRFLVRFGNEGLKHFRGMFALALYDARERTLLLARDFFGAKPLFYAKTPKGFCFASSLPALLEIPGVERRVNALKSYDLLCFGQSNNGCETFVKDVFQVDPAGYLTVRLDDMACTTERYWEPEWAKPVTIGFDDAVKRVRELFLESMELQLRGTGRGAVTLSGGIDSSAILCSIRHLRPEMELHYVSFIAEDERISEENWIDLAGEYAGAIPHKFRLAPTDLLEKLDDLVTALGQPFYSSSCFAQYAVFRELSQAGFDYAWDGQGADDVLGGSEGYPGQRMAGFLMRGRLLAARTLFRNIGSWPNRSRKDLIARTLREFTPAFARNAALRFSGRKPLPAWMDRPAVERLGVKPGITESQRKMFPGKDRMRQLLFYYNVTGPMCILHVDRNSAAFSTEFRDPFQSPDLADFTLSLPEDYLVSPEGRTKNVFREAMRGIVPDAILDRRDKGNFMTPEKEWLFASAGKVEEIFSASSAPLLNLPELLREFRLAREGRIPWSGHFWRCLCYIRWCELLDITE